MEIDKLAGVQSECSGAEPVVSVVMSVLNGERFLRESVESILAQTFRRWELIVINDGSTDRSMSILEEFQKTDSRVRVLTQNNNGLVESLNRGCRCARGKYLARMDADDVAVPERLRLQVEFCEAHPAIAVLGGAIELIDAGGRSLGVSRNPTLDSTIKAGLQRGGTPLWHPTVLMRRDVFVATGGYRNAFVDAEDFDLWLRISEKHQLANLEPILLRYRLHSSQVSVRKCRQQVLSNVAARLSAQGRKLGRPDPLDGMQLVTQTLLEGLGAEKRTLQNAMARGLLSCVNNMSDAGENVIALKALDELRDIDWSNVDKSIRADVHLLEARIHWRQNRRGDSARSILSALWIRPKIVGRPVKILFQRLQSISVH